MIRCNLWCLVAYRPFFVVHPPGACTVSGLCVTIKVPSGYASGGWQPLLDLVLILALFPLLFVAFFWCFVCWFPPVPLVGCWLLTLCFWPEDSFLHHACGGPSVMGAELSVNCYFLVILVAVVPALLWSWHIRYKVRFLTMICFARPIPVSSDVLPPGVYFHLCTVSFHAFSWNRFCGPCS